MAASSADMFTEVGNPGTATTLSSPGHSIGGTSLTVGSTSNWPTSTGVIFAMDTVTLVNGVEVRDAGSYTEWEGVVASSTSITGLVLRYGTDQNYPAGTTSRVYIPVASSREDRLVQGIQVDHNQDGTHKAFAETNLVPTAAIQDSAVTTAKVADDAVTAAKMKYGLVRQRQGNAGATGDATWQNPGGANTDTSAKDAFVQCGSSTGTGTGDFSLTFPVAFNQVPIVVATVTSASGSNASVQITGVTTTTFTCRVHRNTDNVSVVENFNWIAIGQ